jgi:phage terminase small subunit
MREKHKRFVEEYLIDGNGQNAYHRVYPESTLCSAKEAASRLLKRNDIRMELEKAQEERMKNILWSTEDILQQIKDIAQSSDSSTHEKLKALELGAKSLGLFREKVEHSGNISIVLDKEIEDWSE